MGFMRVWWPPVVLGLVIAFLGIGVVEVAGRPVGRTEVAATEPAPPRAALTSVAPAAIERFDDVVEVEPSPRARTGPVVRDAPSPKPAARRTPKPIPKPETKSTPQASPKPAPVLTSTPVPSTSPTAAPKPRATPFVRRPPPPERPADVLDLRPWKLTLPVGEKGHPLELLQPLLGTADNSAFFRVRPDRGVVFRAPVGGVTTENSKYPRAELREMTPDGRRKAAWSSTSGRHVMTITQAITGTPRAKPHVVAGQIHDAEDDVVMIRLEGRRLFVESDGEDVGLLDPNYRLGTRFTVSIAATSAGIRIRYNRPPLRGSSVTGGTSRLRGTGGAPTRVVDVRKAGDGWYFKAGCYVQSDPSKGDTPTAYGEVVIYALALRHT